MKGIPFDYIPFKVEDNEPTHNSGLGDNDLYVIDMLAPADCYMKYENVIVERIVLFVRDQVDNYRIIFQDSVYAPINVTKDELRNTLEVCVG